MRKVKRVDDTLWHQLHLLPAIVTVSSSGFVDYDTILVDLTGFSNADHVPLSSSEGNSWAKVTANKRGLYLLVSIES